MCMQDIIISALFLFIDSVILFIFGLRRFRAYKKTGNIHHLMFFRLSVLVGIGLLFYAIPTGFFPHDKNILGITYILAIPPLFWGLNYAFRSALLMLDYKTLERLARIIIPVLIVVFFLFHFSAIPDTRIESGFVARDVASPYGYLYGIFLVTLALFPGVVFLMQEWGKTDAVVKKVFFASTFILASLGGIGIVVISNPPFLVLTSHLLLLVAFIFLFLIPFAEVSSQDKSY